MCIEAIVSTSKLGTELLPTSQLVRLAFQRIKGLVPHQSVMLIVSGIISEFSDPNSIYRP